MPSAAGLTVRTVLFAMCPSLAVMVAWLVDATAVVATTKVANEYPEGTVTELGTVAIALLEERATVVPAAGAMPSRLTVPMETLPPDTDSGKTVTK